MKVKVCDILVFLQTLKLKKLPLNLINRCEFLSTCLEHFIIEGFVAYFELFYVPNYAIISLPPPYLLN